jgi:hypothetical protein
MIGNTNTFKTTVKADDELSPIKLTILHSGRRRFSVTHPDLSANRLSIATYRMHQLSANRIPNIIPESSHQLLI